MRFLLSTDVQTQPPFIESEYNGGPVDRSHIVYLSCDTPGAEIFYTTDGRTPQLHLPDIKVGLSYLYSNKHNF